MRYPDAVLLHNGRRSASERAFPNAGAAECKRRTRCLSRQYEDRHIAVARKVDRSCAEPTRKDIRV